MGLEKGLRKDFPRFKIGSAQVEIPVPNIIRIIFTRTLNLEYMISSLQLHYYLFFSWCERGTRVLEVGVGESASEAELLPIRRSSCRSL